MFNALKIKKYQSHKDTILDFHPGINAIIPADPSNPNDVGKSSIIRTIEILMGEKPYLVRHFSNFAGKEGITEISADLSEGINVKLEKYVKRNKKGIKQLDISIDENSVYWIDEKDYPKFGRTIPDEVLKVLNLTALNIQSQHDRPFLVTSSGGKIARTINRITKVEESDKWVSELTTEINTANKDIKGIESEISDIESELDKYEGIEKTGNLINRLESIVERIDEYENEHYNLLAYIDSITLLDNQIKGKDELLEECFGLVNEIEDNQNELESLTEENDIINQFIIIEKEIKGKGRLLTECFELVDHIEENQKQLEIIYAERAVIHQLISVEDEIKDLSDIEELEDDIKQIDGWSLQLMEVREKIDLLEEEKNSIDDLFWYDNKIENIEMDKENIKESYGKRLKDLGKCPTCFIDVNNKTLKQILKEI